MRKLYTLPDQLTLCRLENNAGLAIIIILFWHHLDETLWYQAILITGLLKCQIRWLIVNSRECSIYVALVNFRMTLKLMTWKGAEKKACQISHCISFRDDANILFINQSVPVCHQGHAINEFITTYTLQLKSSQNDMKHALAIKVPWSNN